MKVAAQWRDRAIHEAQDAFDWYEAKSLGLGERFLGELDAHVDTLVQHPKGYSKWRGPYKRINLHRFPYILVFRLAKNTVIIFQRLPQQAEPGGMGFFPIILFTSPQAVHRAEPITPSRSSRSSSSASRQRPYR